MNLRGIPIRRSLKTKILFLSFVLATFLLYIKFITNNTDGIENESNIHSVKPKLVEEDMINIVDQQPLAVMDDDVVVAQSADLYKQYIDADIAKQIKGLGDNGQSASLVDAASKEVGERQLKKIALNEELSEHISYNRTLQDARNPLCRLQHFNLNELPTASVVIIFYNVIWFSIILLRLYILFNNYKLFFYHTRNPSQSLSAQFTV